MGNNLDWSACHMASLCPRSQDLGSLLFGRLFLCPQGSVKRICLEKQTLLPWQKQTVPRLVYEICSAFVCFCNFSVHLFHPSVFHPWPHCPCSLPPQLQVHSWFFFFMVSVWSKASSSVVKHRSRTGAGKSASSQTEDLVSCVVMYGTAELLGFQD